MTSEAVDVPEDERQRIERALNVRRFSDGEMQRRIARACGALQREGLDGLLVTDEVNVKYFTGMATPSFATPTRPLAVIVTANGDSALVCSRSQSANARAASAIQDIRPFERFEPDAIDTIADTLASLGLDRGRIGAELGPEQRLGLTYLGVRTLFDRLSGARFDDGGPVVWATRSLKSNEELERMRRAASLNSVAMTEAVLATRPGDTERSIRTRWATALMAGGADRPGYLAMHSGLGSYRRVSGEPTDRQLATGDLVWMDGGPVVDGYWSDITRMAAVGPARAEDRERYAFAWHVVQDLIASIRPGMTAGDVARHAAGVFAAAGSPMGGASRIGHGIGLQLTEPPSVVDGDETELVPGMTLAIETGLAAWDGYFLMEDNIVITERGAELLSQPAPPELPELT